MKNNKKVFQINFNLNGYTLIDNVDTVAEAANVFLKAIKNNPNNIDIRISEESPKITGVYDLNKNLQKEEN